MSNRSGGGRCRFDTGVSKSVHRTKLQTERWVVVEISNSEVNLRIIRARIKQRHWQGVTPGWVSHPGE